MPSLSLVLDVVSWALIATGAGFSLLGGIGLLRMPDLFTRMHAASLTDTMGALGILGGLAVQAINGAHWMSLIKLALILLFLLFTSPISGHALAQAALKGGVKPLLHQDRTRPAAPAPAKAGRKAGKTGGKA